MVTKTSLANANNAQTYTHFLTRAHFEKDQEFRRFRNASLTENQIYTEFSQGLQQRFFTLTELPPLPNDSWFWAQLSAASVKAIFLSCCPGSKQPLDPPQSVSLFTVDPIQNTIAMSGSTTKIELGEARWNGETEYQLQNQEIFQSFLNNGKNTIRITNPTSAGTLIDILMLNWIQIDYWRNFNAEKNVLPFAITPLLDEIGAVNPNFEVQLKNFSTPDIEIYGIDGTRYVGLSPIADDKVPGTYKVLFQSSQIRPKTVDDPTIQYIALTRNQFRKPKISVDAPSDLRSTQNAADYIIITHHHFLQDVQPPRRLPPATRAAHQNR